MIPAGTKCVIKKVPSEGIYANLLGANVTACNEQGARGTGTQCFKLKYCVIYGNGNSGFVVEPQVTKLEEINLTGKALLALPIGVNYRKVQISQLRYSVLYGQI